MNELREEEYARKLRGMDPSVGVTIYPDSYPRRHWSAGSRLVDFISRYTGFFFDANANRYLDRESVEDAVNYILLELIENAVKYGSNGDIDVNVDVHTRELCLTVVNPIGSQDIARLNETFQELSSDDPAEQLVRRIEENASNPDSLESGLGLLTILSDYGATVAWHFRDSNLPGRTRLTIITRFPVYRSER